MIGLVVVAVLSSAEPPPDAHPFARRALIPLAVSAAALLSGGLFLGISVTQTNEAAALEPEPREAALFVATNNRVGGVLFLAAGALAAGISAFLFFFEPVPGGPSLSFAPLPGGALLGLTWSGP